MYGRHVSTNKRHTMHNPDSCQSPKRATFCDEMLGGTSALTSQGERIRMTHTGCARMARCQALACHPAPPTTRPKIHMFLALAVSDGSASKVSPAVGGALV